MQHQYYTLHISSTSILYTTHSNIINHPSIINIIHYTSIIQHLSSTSILYTTHYPSSNIYHQHQYYTLHIIHHPTSIININIIHYTLSIIQHLSSTSILYTTHYPSSNIYHQHQYYTLHIIHHLSSCININIIHYTSIHHTIQHLLLYHQYSSSSIHQQHQYHPISSALSSIIKIDFHHHPSSTFVYI